MIDSTLSTDPAPFQIALPLFSGPLDDLVRLAVERKVPTEDIMVAEIAAQYAGRLGRLEAVDLDETAEFLGAAARLLLLKSSRILAQPAPLEDEALAASVRESWIDRPGLESLARHLAVIEGRESIVPPCPPFAVDRRIEPQAAHALRRAWDDMVRRRGRESAPVVVPAFVRLETAVSALIRRLKSTASLSFRHLTHGLNRQDAVVHFLAVLELVRRRQASVSQDEPFAEITVDYVERSTDAAARAG